MIRLGNLPEDYWKYLSQDELSVLLDLRKLQTRRMLRAIMYGDRYTLRVIYCPKITWSFKAYPLFHVEDVLHAIGERWLSGLERPAKDELLEELCEATRNFFPIPRHSTVPWRSSMGRIQGSRYTTTPTPVSFKPYAARFSSEFLGPVVSLSDIASRVPIGSPKGTFEHSDYPLSHWVSCSRSGASSVGPETPLKASDPPIDCPGPTD